MNESGYPYEWARCLHTKTKIRVCDPPDKEETTHAYSFRGNCASHGVVFCSEYSKIDQALSSTSLTWQNPNGDVRKNEGQGGGNFAADTVLYCPSLSLLPNTRLLPTLSLRVILQSTYIPRGTPYPVCHVP